MQPKLSFTVCSGGQRIAGRSSNATTLLIDKNTSVRDLPASDLVYRRNISILARFQIISKGLLTNKTIVPEFLPRIIFKQAARTLVLMLLCQFKFKTLQLAQGICFNLLLF